MPKFESWVKCHVSPQRLKNSPYLFVHDLHKCFISRFIIQIELVKCPSNSKDWNQTLNISPIGVPESLKLSLSFMCDCECESKIDNVSFSLIRRPLVLWIFYIDFYKQLFYVGLYWKWSALWRNGNSKMWYL